MTVPEAMGLARIRHPGIAPDMAKRVSDAAASADRAPRVNSPSERSFAMIVASVEGVRESTIVCGFEPTGGRLDIVMAAVARVVVGALRFPHGADLRPHPLIVRSKRSRFRPQSARMTAVGGIG